jgi:hypothetical protein
VAELRAAAPRSPRRLPRRRCTYALLWAVAWVFVARSEPCLADAKKRRSRLAESAILDPCSRTQTYQIFDLYHEVLDRQAAKRLPSLAKAETMRLIVLGQIGRVICKLPK